MEYFNRALFLLINADSQSSIVAIYVALFFAEYLIYAVPALLVCMWLWGKPGSRAVALTAAITVGFALLLNQITGMLWPHPRPFMIPLGNVFFAHAPENSFPSDHVTVIVGLGMSLLFNGRQSIGASIIGLGLLTGLSRVYLGVHFPFDIIGSCGVAICAVWLVTRSLPKSRHAQRLFQILEQAYRRLFAFPIYKGWVR